MVIVSFVIRRSAWYLSGWLLSSSSAWSSSSAVLTTKKHHTLLSTWEVILRHNKRVTTLPDRPGNWMELVGPWQSVILWSDGDFTWNAATNAEGQEEGSVLSVLLLSFWRLGSCLNPVGSLLNRLYGSELLLVPNPYHSRGFLNLKV